MLTKRQKQILDFVTSYDKRKGFAPSLKETKKHFGLKSESTIHEHLEILREKGYLQKQKNQPRGIELKKLDELIRIPVLGYIAAGQPIEAIEVPDSVIMMPKNEIGRQGEFYALRVGGDSMIEEGIFDGDTVVIKKQEVADDGQTVVAIIDDNEATLKKIYRGKNRFRLQPANQTMLPIFRKEVEIRGVVIKIIRNLENEIKKDNSSLISAQTLEERKRIFLNRIKSINGNSRNKYKRVAVSPIRYAGGKSLGVGFIVELIPNNTKRIISPFIGGGSVEIACSKYLGLEVIGFDIFDILVNYWKTQINNSKELFQKLSLFKPSQEVYKEIKEKLKAHWKNEKKLPMIDLAAHYYFNHNLSYGPGFLGWPSNVYLNQERYQTMLEKVRDFYPRNLKVECLSFEKVFEKYPNDFFYCDPPYLLGEDTKMFRGIYPMRNIPIHHNGFKHDKLRDLLKNHKGGFILSYNNCKTIKDWYKEYRQYFPEWQYTMGQGETRIGKNRKNGNNNHIKESHEILIFCPPR